jgi:ORF6N domain-containing protein
MPSPEELAQLVFVVRGEKVMFDADLAKLYGVTTKALNQAMSRNKARFPEDFAFRVTRPEFDSLRSQIVTTSKRLRSPRAVEVNIAIMRTFVQLRWLMDTNRDLARKIEALEKKYDEKFAVVFEAIKQLVAPPDPPKRQIGFRP